MAAKNKNINIFRVTLSIADVIDQSFELPEEVVNDQLRLRLMVYLQNDMDFENTAGILIKRKSSDLMFQFLNRRDLRKSNKKKAIFCAFKECLQTDELALAMQIWHSFKSMV